MAAWWVWLTVAGVIIAVVAAIVLVVCRLKRKPHSMTRDLSRFTESFRCRFNKDGISNPVFDADHVRIPKSARTLPRTDNSTAIAAPTGTKHMNNNVTCDFPKSLTDAHRRMSDSYDFDTKDHSGNAPSRENHYVDLDPPALSQETKCGLYDTPKATQFDTAIRLPLPDTPGDNYETIPDPISIYDEPNPHAPSLEAVYDVPKSDKVNEKVPTPVPSPQPTRIAPEPGKSAKSKRKRRKKDPVYGNIETPSSARSSTEQSEDCRSSTEVYMNVTGAAHVKQLPHKALEDPEDTYDFAPKSSASDIYVGHSPGSTLSGHAVLENESDSSSSDSNVYQAVNESGDYDNLKTDVAIENPLFGLDSGPEDIYENDKEEETGWRTVSLGHDHVYETLA